MILRTAFAMMIQLGTISAKKTDSGLNYDSVR